MKFPRSTFASVLMSPTTGIILNNEMDDFSVPDTDDTYSVKASAFNLVTVGVKGWGIQRLLTE